MTERRRIRRQIKDSRRQEEQGMARLGGQRHRGSGNGARKGDGRTTANAWYDSELIEFKRTGKTQITIKASDLQKIAQEAAVTGRIPGLAFELQGKHYIIHEEADWLEYRDRAR